MRVPSGLVPASASPAHFHGASQFASPVGERQARLIVATGDPTFHERLLKLADARSNPGVWQSCVINNLLMCATEPNGADGCRKKGVQSDNCILEMPRVSVA